MTEDRHTRFALALHRHLSGDGGSACSPWSVSCALAAVAAGADDDTREEIRRTLAAGGEHAGLLDDLAQDARAVAAPRDGDESALEVATRLWVDEGRTPSASFTEALGGWPGGAVRQAPVVRAPEEAREAVNRDVAEATRGLVPEILPAGSLHARVRALLVNAVYLLAGWAQPFREAATTDAPFHAPAGTRPVPTMQAVHEAAYAQRNGWAYLSLPLQRGLRAEVLLPEGALPSAEHGLDAAALADLRGAATLHRVDLWLPRFRVAGGGSLTPALAALGLSRLLDGSAAPLTDVVAEEPLGLSDAFHRAVLRVDERGVEGAAATALVMRTVALREMPEARVRVDRPFLVLVTHQRTGVVIFIARVVEP